MESNGNGGDRSIDRLDSWKEIAAYLKRDTRTVQRWEKHEHLPVRRKLHDKLGSVYAFKRELDAWWNEGRPALGIEPLAPVAVARPRLAVLPLRNLSGDPSQEYFSEGLTEELIAQLSRIDPARLGVIARSSVTTYLARQRGIDNIERDLGVGYVLDGSVRRGHERVRISVQLIRTRDQSHVWAETYDRDLPDILELQSEVARAVTAEITAKMASPASRSPGPVDPETYSAYLMGRCFWNKRTLEGLMKAIEHLERAASSTPTYAPALAGLADCHALLANIEVGLVPAVEAMPKAKAAAERALALDPTLGEAHASLGFAHFWFDWDWPAAEAEFKRAIELRPDYATARQWYAAYLQSLSRMDEATSEIRRALELDPLSNVLRAELAALYYLERDYDRSVELSRQTLDLDPRFWLAYFNLGRSLTQKGEHRAAVAELKQAYELSEGSSGMTMALGHAYAAAGKKGEALKMIDTLTKLARRRYVPAFYTAAIYAGLGDREKVFAYLAKARAERCDYLVHLPKEPAADAYRDDPRFAQIVPRVGQRQPPDVALQSSSGP